MYNILKNFTYFWYSFIVYSYRHKEVTFFFYNHFTSIVVLRNKRIIHKHLLSRFHYTNLESCYNAYRKVIRLKRISQRKYIIQFVKVTSFSNSWSPFLHVLSWRATFTFSSAKTICLHIALQNGGRAGSLITRSILASAPNLCFFIAFIFMKYTWLKLQRFTLQNSSIKVFVRLHRKAF